MTNSTGNRDLAVSIAASLFAMSIPPGFAEFSEEDKRLAVADLSAGFHETLAMLGFEVVERVPDGQPIN